MIKGELSNNIFKSILYLISIFIIGYIIFEIKIILGYLIIASIIALLSIFFFGGEILKGFSLAMIFGVVFGTYSSIYIANTVLVRLKVSQKTILKEEEKN